MISTKIIHVTLLSVWGGGNGVYSFFLNLAFFTFFVVVCLNLGKNLSQDSFFNSGSLASSLLIISVYKREKSQVHHYEKTDH